MKHTLVTGGAGFIGSHLVARLLKDGQMVTVLDNFSTGRQDNLASLLEEYPDQLYVRTHDVQQEISSLGRVDWIFNLACPASPPHYQLDPIGTLLTSVLGAKNLLDLAHRTGARILQASTSEVYGDPIMHPQPETYWGNVNPHGERSCYDEGKRAAESLFMDYYRRYGVDVRLVRIFNTYGPNMRPDDGRVVSNFIMQALRGEPISIYGDGTQTRSFQYVDDCVNGLLAMMEQDELTGPVNIGNPQEFTIQELAEKVLALFPEHGGTILHLPLPADDPTQRRPDISVATERLGWSPRISLQAGLPATIGYFRQEIAKSKEARALVAQFS